VTAVQLHVSNHPSEWQEEWQEREYENKRISKDKKLEPAE
jgi:formate dehydrogenase major subunit